MTHSHKSKRPYDVLDGLGEAMLNLARKHSTTQQWASWLKVLSVPYILCCNVPNIIHQSQNSTVPPLTPSAPPFEFSFIRFFLIIVVFTGISYFNLINIYILSIFLGVGGVERNCFDLFGGVCVCPSLFLFCFSFLFV